MRSRCRRCWGWIIGRWWATLLLVAACCIVPSAVVAAVWCKWYWGYVLAPPGVDGRVRHASKLVAYGHMTFRYDWSNPAWPLIAFDDSGDRVHFEWFDGARGGSGAWRLDPSRQDGMALKLDWIDRGVIGAHCWPLRSVKEERVMGLADLVKSTGRLSAGELGDGLPHDRASLHAYELLGESGDRLLWIAVFTGPLDKGRHAYYELLYDDGGVAPLLIDRRHWMFDSGRLERFEFVLVTTIIAMPLLLISLPPIVICRALKHRRRSSRLARGLCPQCGYDIKGDLDWGCPECGWGRKAPRRREGEDER